MIQISLHELWSVPATPIIQFSHQDVVALQRWVWDAAEAHNPSHHALLIIAALQCSKQGYHGGSVTQWSFTKHSGYPRKIKLLSFKIKWVWPYLMSRLRCAWQHARNEEIQDMSFDSEWVQDIMQSKLTVDVVVGAAVERWKGQLVLYLSSESPQPVCLQPTICLNQIISVWSSTPQWQDHLCHPQPQSWTSCILNNSLPAPTDSAALVKTHLVNPLL